MNLFTSYAQPTDVISRIDVEKSHFLSLIFLVISANSKTRTQLHFYASLMFLMDKKETNQIAAALKNLENHRNHTKLWLNSKLPSPWKFLRVKFVSIFDSILWVSIPIELSAKIMKWNTKTWLFFFRLHAIHQPTLHTTNIKAWN